MRKHPKRHRTSKRNTASSSKALRHGRKNKSVPPCKPKRQPRHKPLVPARVPFNESSHDGGFMELLLKRMGWDQLNGLQQRKHAAGRPTHVLSRGQLLAALLFHYTVTWAGTFAEHLLLLFRITMSESSLSDRRQALPFTVFEQLLARLLRPLGKVCESAYYGGLLLVAIDGVRFSLANTKQAKKCRKGRNQNGRAAFAKLQCSALVELMLHNPLAARLGWKGESEWKLAQPLLDHLPEKCLLLADRLYGCGAFLVQALDHLSPRHGHFLVRVKEGMRIGRVIRKLRDGSRIVEIHALDTEDHHRVMRTIQVRDIRARVQRPGHRSVPVRLWTSLLDPTQAPAKELVHLYITRWEQELYFRELKRELGVNDLLRSLTPETAAQEVAAMIIGSSLIAEERSKLRPGEELCHRVSFIKVWETLEPLWLTLILGADILSEGQKQQLTDRFYWFASTRLMDPKRTRSCPRAMRQPIQPWPRKRNQKSSTGPLSISIAPANS